MSLMLRLQEYRGSLQEYRGTGANASCADALSAENPGT